MLAHGSRHPQGVASIERLRDAVAARSGRSVHAAYLDLNQPDLTAAARQIVAAGHRRAVVVPLLFTPAFHARTDAPATLTAARAATGLDLRRADILGTPDALLPVLMEAARSAGIPDTGELLLASVGSSRPEANAEVADLAERLAALRGAPVRAAFATCAPRVSDLVAELGCAGVLALFVGHGLLLDKVRAAAAERGLPTSQPLEDKLVPLVLERTTAVPHATTN
ncbi:sirohydrochlorin chelatase [Microlunatus sp. Gsoil 973]|uniref:sirohydrochlorin chelatase n=1 Tax=Microlunatus sp. Gsoil 973 TaxID=2672569 RepID=UPI0018A86D63|nr:CbiX/SirB N-terminal domain-containing protein [Microlunatus sp. Gsoil 973]